MSPRSKIVRKPVSKQSLTALSEIRQHAPTRTVATAVEQKQWFGGIGQRDQEWMVAVLAVVGEIHTLHCTRHRSRRACRQRPELTVEELGGLLSPDSQAGFGDQFHQGHDIDFTEAARQKSPASRGIGDAARRPGNVEINLVVASQFEVFDAAPPPARALKAMFRTWSDS